MLYYLSRFERVSKQAGFRLHPESESERESRRESMKTAIIETGGKQYRVAEGDVVFLEKLDAQEGESVTFDRVLAVMDEESSVFGAPALDGVTVSATVQKNGRSKKIRVFKMKPKKGYRRTQGHRQPYTRVEINTING